MEGPNMNVEMNNFHPSSREQMMGMDNYGRMNPMMHPGQMPGYNPYNRENFNPGDQHGGMTGSPDIVNESIVFPRKLLGDLSFLLFTCLLCPLPGPTFSILDLPKSS
jgi:hypothetical protein